MFDFLMPTEIIGGDGALHRAGDRLRKLGGRCLLVTGRSGAKASGALSDCTRVLDDCGIGWELFDEIEPNPDVLTCFRAAARARLSGAEFVIGIGGGSPLDAAKVVGLLAANDITVSDLYALKWEHRPLPVVCIGTTAGTGSEVTHVSVLTRDGRKRSVTHRDLTPALSLCDSHYTASCDLRTTMSCGLDALSHALEGYFSGRATTLTDSIAISACQKLSGALAQIAGDEHCQAGGTAISAKLRDELYTGSILAGFVLNSCGTGFPHAMGYLLTERFGLPHGYACAAFMPEYLEQASRFSTTKLHALGLRLDRLSAFAREQVPLEGIRLDPAEIDVLCERFIDNKNFRNTPGQPGVDFAANILRRKFASAE